MFTSKPTRVKSVQSPMFEAGQSTGNVVNSPPLETGSGGKVPIPFVRVVQNCGRLRRITSTGFRGVCWKTQNSSMETIEFMPCEGARSFRFCVWGSSSAPSGDINEESWWVCIKWNIRLFSTIFLSALRRFFGFVSHFGN